MPFWCFVARRRCGSFDFYRKRLRVPLDRFKDALKKYVECRNKELELMRQTEDEADRAGNAFDEAIKALSGERPRIAPPGRNGVVALRFRVSSRAPMSSTLRLTRQSGLAIAARSLLRCWRPMTRRRRTTFSRGFSRRWRSVRVALSAYSMASWMFGGGCLWDTETSKLGRRAHGRDDR